MIMVLMVMVLMMAIVVMVDTAMMIMVLVKVGSSDGNDDGNVYGASGEGGASASGRPLTRLAS